MNGNAKTTELLAPAGSYEAAHAAFAFGADAIYLGLAKFSARADAANFTLPEVSDIIGFAHAQEKRRKVFAAVNTLVQDAELPELIATLENLAELGADAVIVQDLGVAGLVRRHFPQLPLHASTQMAIHNRAGAEAALELGISRVVLARELTLDEIADIAQRVPIETEIFIHGALCYSMSGLCLFSSATTGRSANRGSCAYPCRDIFRGEDGSGISGHIFSMKDLALGEDVRKLVNAGVSSLKIEGRKKAPLYVAAATDYYRAILDGSGTPESLRERERRLKTIFSRPQTKLYLETRKAKGVIDPAIVGHRGAPVGSVARIFHRNGEEWLAFTPQADIERHDGLQIDLADQERPFGFAIETMLLRGKQVFAAKAGTPIEVTLPHDHPPIPPDAPLYAASSQAVKRAYPFTMPRPGAFRVRLPFAASITLGENRIDAEAWLEDGSRAALSESPELQSARDAAGVEKACRDSFAKCGDTPFRLGELIFANPHSRFMAASQFNDIRRRLIEDLWATHENVKARNIKAIMESLPQKAPEGASRWVIAIDNPETLDGFEAADRAGVAEIILDIGSATQEATAKIHNDWPDATLRIALPVLCRAWEERPLRERAGALMAAGFAHWEAANLWGWQLLRGHGGLDITAGWPLYTMNAAAADTLLRMGFSAFTLSPEDSRENTEGLLRRFGPRARLPVYCQPPLFISENCITPGCGDTCPKPCLGGAMTLRSRHKDDLWLIRKSCRNFVVSHTARCIASSLPDLPATTLRADFLLRPFMPGEALRIWRELRANKNPHGSGAWNWSRGFLNS